MSTETSVQSWGSRVGGAFKGILVGIVLIIAGIALLFWNEGRTIKQTKNLKEGAANVIEIDSATLNAENEGKLIHISGDAKTEETLVDPFFEVVKVNALKLNRKVEVYQWVEETDTKTERGSGGKEVTTTTYSYHKEWREGLLDSSSFHDAGHDNPTIVPVESQDFVATNITVGAFTLSKSLIDSISSSQDFSPKTALKAKADAQVEQANNTSAETSGLQEIPQNQPDVVTSQQEVATPIEADVSAEYQSAFLPDDYDEYDSGPDPVEAAQAQLTREAQAGVQIPETVNGFTLTESGFYRGNPQNPVVGDVKVTYTTTPSPTRVSIISQQRGDSFVPYQTKNGKIDMLSDGEKSAADMFASAQTANKVTAWLLRLIGFVVIFSGFNMLFAPLSVLADIIPIASSIVGTGTGIVAFCLSLCISLLTIAVGWIAYRPVLAITLIVVGIAAIAYPIIKKRGNTAQKV